MSKLKAKEYKRFEDIKHIRNDGSEFWSARELAPTLEYNKWENFHKVIKRAMIACENSGHLIADDFPEVRKIVSAGATSKPVKDYELTRYACYLIVQNGDPRKEVIALGRTLFCYSNVSAEVADHFNELDEDRRRLVCVEILSSGISFLRKQHMTQVLLQMKSLQFFRMLDTWGYMVVWMLMIYTRRKGLEVGQKILDYISSTELIANLFRISQTEEKLRKDEIIGAKAATATHYKVGKEVRGSYRKNRWYNARRFAEHQKKAFSRLKKNNLPA